MNDVKFKRLVFSNFMSYGDLPNTVEFIDGLTYLNAANGYGKSTIIEALTYVLYGKSYRGGNISELKNTENKNCDMVVTLDFSVDVNSEHHEYSIERRLNAGATSSSPLKIIVDGKKVAKKSGMGQSDFETDVLGFGQRLYKTVIALNSQETTPFLEQAALEKRKLIEDVISTNTDKWKKPNSKSLSDATIQFDVAAKSIERIKSDIVYQEGLIKSLQNDKAAEIDRMQQELDTERAKVLPLTESVNALKTAMDAHKVKYDAIQSAQQESANVYREIESYNTCIRYIDDIKHEESMIKQYQDEIDAAKVSLAGMDIDSIKNRITEISSMLISLKSELNSKSMELGSCKSYVNQYANLKNDIQAKAESQHEGVPCPTCGKPSTKEDVEKVKEALRKEWSDANAKYKINVSLVSEIEDKISQINIQITTLTDELNDKNTKLNEYNSFYASNIRPFEMNIQNSQMHISQMQSTLSKYSSNVDELLAHVNDLNRRKDELTEILSTSNIVYEEYNTAAQKYNDEFYSLRELNQNVSRMQNELFNAKSKQNDGALKQAIEHLDELNMDLDKAKHDLSKYSDVIKVCKCVNQICSDEGLKSYILKLFVPHFNNAVEDNLRRFNLPFHIVFDKTMDYKFTSMLGTAPDYEMLSQGQKRKVAFAIAMAFCDFVFTISNFRINCMFLDEILDISTDDQSLRDMVSLVRTRTEKTPCIFAVTHRARVIQDLFDYKLNINFNGLFSSIGDLDDLRKNVKIAE